MSPLTAPSTIPSDTVPPQGLRRRVSLLLLVGLAGYYGLSCVTLPLADDVWWGEAPLLALVQMPKMSAKESVQAGLIGWARRAGWSRGSPSPDRIMTHPWALGFVLTTPVLLCLAAVAVLGQLVPLRWHAAGLVVMAIADGAVTIWFDHTSRLSLF